MAEHRPPKKMSAHLEKLLFALSSVAPDKEAISNILKNLGHVDWQFLLKKSCDIDSAAVVYDNLRRLALLNELSAQDKKIFKKTALIIMLDNTFKLKQFVRID